MMIVSDGRYANPAPSPRIGRMMEFIAEGLCDERVLVAAAAARIARQFPGAIFRPSALQAQPGLDGATNRTEALNALIALAAATPDGVEGLETDRGQIAMSLSRSSIAGVMLHSADAISRRLNTEGLAILVNGLTERSADYCVMGTRPETEIIPGAIDRALTALGPDAVSEDMSFCLVSCEGERVDILEVSMSLRLEPAPRAEMAL